MIHQRPFLSMLIVPIWPEEAAGLERHLIAENLEVWCRGSGRVGVIVALRHCADGQSCLGWKRFVGGQGRQGELIICYRSEFQSIASPRPCTTRQVCGALGFTNYCLEYAWVLRLWRRIPRASLDCRAEVRVGGRWTERYVRLPLACDGPGAWQRCSDLVGSSCNQ